MDPTQSTTPSDPTGHSFPLGEFLGLSWETLGPGVAVGTIGVTERHLNPNGVVHGAVIFAAMDTVMGSAVMSVVGDGETCSTVDLHVRYHSAIRSGTLATTARILSEGRKLITLTAETVDRETGGLVASGTGTFIRIGG